MRLDFQKTLLLLFSAWMMNPVIMAGNDKPEKYLIVGYAGKDTLHLGEAIPDRSGVLTMDLKQYKGSIKLVPQNEEYADIEKHLAKISQINSQETFEAAKAYANDTLRFEVLYRSGMWKEYVQHWVGFYAQSSKSPEEFASLFVPAARKALDRVVKSDSFVASILTRDLIEFFEQYNLTKAAEIIAAYSMGLEIKDGEHSDLTRRLVVSSKLMGGKAPALIEKENSLDVSDLGKTLLIFYESGCGSCEIQLNELKSRFSVLDKKGITVISISADNDERVYEFHSKDYPWQYKFCDYKGFGGDNFKTYGVVATPTIYVLDGTGTITGRYAKMEETGLMD